LPAPKRFVWTPTAVTSKAGQRYGPQISRCANHCHECSPKGPGVVRQPGFEGCQPSMAVGSDAHVEDHDLRGIRGCQVIAPVEHQPDRAAEAEGRQSRRSRGLSGRGPTVGPVPARADGRPGSQVTFGPHRGAERT
jgi:hypothetical protein